MSDHKPHTNFKQCYSGQVSRGNDCYGNPKYDRYEANEANEYYGSDSYGNSKYEDRDDYGNYKCEEEE